MFSRGVHKFGPRCRIWRHAAHKVIGGFHPFIERQATSVFENLWRVVHLRIRGKFYLRNWVDVALHDVIDRAANEGCSEIHQFVVNIFGIVCVKDLHFFAMQHQSSVNFVIQQEGSHSCLLFSIDNRPVDGSSSTILWQKRGMKVEGAMRRHVPHHLRQHAESYYHLHIGTEIAELL